MAGQPWFFVADSCKIPSINQKFKLSWGCFLGHPLIQFWDIRLSRPTDLSTLMAEPTNRPGLTGKDMTYFREQVSLSPSKC